MRSQKERRNMLLDSGKKTKGQNKTWLNLYTVFGQKVEVVNNDLGYLAKDIAKESTEGIA